MNNYKRLIFINIVIILALFLSSCQEDEQKESSKINQQMLEKIKSKIDTKKIIGEAMGNYQKQIDELIFEYSASPVLMPVPKNSKKQTLTVFLDFACPHCKTADEELIKRQVELKDKLNVNFVFFPLNAECNPNVKQGRKPYSCVAFKVALCSRSEGKQELAMKYLFDNMNNYQTLFANSDAEVIKLATKELKLKSLQKCLQPENIKKLIDSENAIYKNIQIPGTPYTLLNGRPIKPIYKNPKAFAVFLQKIKELESVKK